MKDLITKLIGLIASLKGKKPIVIGIVAIIFILGYFAIQKGYITQDMLDMDFITKQIESLFTPDKAPVDTLNQKAPVILDTLINN